MYILFYSYSFLSENVKSSFLFNKKYFYTENVSLQRFVSYLLDLNATVRMRFRLSQNILQYSTTNNEVNLSKLREIHKPLA